MPDTASNPLSDGVVFRVQSGNYFVQTDHGVVMCKLRGNLKKELVFSTSNSGPRRVTHSNKRRSTDPLAVGDHVRIDSELEMIETILARHSEFSRDSPGGRGQHVLVANLDRVYVTFAAANPPPDLTLLDRFLVMAESADLQAALIVNKLDLLSDDEAATRALFAEYARIGYPVFFTCAKRGWGINELRDSLRDKISAFAGPSGVGKSSLLNAVQPGLTLKTGDISKSSLAGRHTTTSAELLPLDFGGWVADTPGLRQVDFWEVEKSEVVYCFPEFAPYLGQCRYSDCSHNTDNECAIREAVEEGRILRRRYESYISIMAC